jgi:GH25 family lysozyme M1 (1,4-beta-N-acetylmuramidase)
MSEVMDTTSTAASSSSGSDASRETTTTTAAGDTTSTAAASTTAESTTATTAATTAGNTTTGSSQSTTAGTTTATQPTTTQPATTVAAKKNYRVLNLEPVVETEKKSVYSDGWHTINGSKYYYSNGKAYTGWNEIDGIQYYFSSTGVLSSKTVIDVSRFNGTIDWNAVKASGIDYAIIRVGYRGYGSGTLTWDSTFDTNMQGAIAAGIKVGAYIVTQAVNTQEAVEEASFIVNACSKYSISLPLVIDVESAGGGTGRGDQISVSTRTAVINAFAQTVKNAGYTPMVYASKTWLEGRINSGSISSYCKVWIARYSDTLGYSGRYNMWQFRSDGSVNGVSGNVDISAWIN